jgi:type IV secretory pathway TraG/TraD family ATPase VirD4
LVFVENLLPIKCHKIKYYEDKIFRARLLPAPGVQRQDISKYSGGRTDDHFAMWQQRVGKGQGVSAPRTTPLAAVQTSAPAASALSPETDFSLDFSTVRIPEGRFLTGVEIDSAVQSFLDELDTA